MNSVSHWLFFQGSALGGGGGAWATSGSRAGCACGRSEVSYAAWLAVHGQPLGGQPTHRGRLPRRPRGRGRRKPSSWAGLQAGGGACGGRAGAPREAGRALNLLRVLLAWRPAPEGPGLERFPGPKRRSRLAVEGLGGPGGPHDPGGLPASGCSCPSP